MRCSPDWAAPITGIPVGKIEEAATIYGEGPSLLWLGQGLQRQPTGGNVFRAVGLLPAATGNFAKPGAGFLYLNGGARRGIDGDYLEAPHLRQGEKRKVSHMDLVATLSDPRKAQALVTWNINIAASNPDQARLHRVLRDERLFHVAVDPFPTDTTDFADYRAAGGELPGVRRHRVAVFPSVDVGAGEGAGADGRGAAEPGDLPPPCECDGLQRARAVRG